jgi:hypothetical protein
MAALVSEWTDSFLALGVFATAFALAFASAF